MLSRAFQVDALPRHTLGSVVATYGRVPKFQTLSYLCFMAKLPCVAEADFHAKALVDRDASKRCAKQSKPRGAFLACVAAQFAQEPVLAVSLWGSLRHVFGPDYLRAPATLAAMRSLQRAPWIVAAATQVPTPGRAPRGCFDGPCARKELERRAVACLQPS